MSAMKPLPFPVRIAAGLVAIAVEQARDLPRLIIEFPVTAVSQALQAPRRVQQKITELAIKGDRLLNTLYPDDERPSSATFGEDAPPSHNGASTITEMLPVGRPTPLPPDGPHTDSPHADLVLNDLVLNDLPPVPPTAEDVPADTGTDEFAAAEVVAEATANPVDSPEAGAVLDDLPPVLPEAEDVPADTGTDDLAAPEVVAEAITDPVDSPEAGAVLDDAPPVLPEAEDVPADAVNDDLALERVIAEATAKPVNSSERPALSGYAEMPIAELRSKLAFLELDDLQALLAWEMAHGERAPFVTLLTNRITTVQQE
jgi:hypothetical protein